MAIHISCFPAFCSFIAETIGLSLVCTNLITVFAHPPVITRSALFLTIHIAIRIFSWGAIGTNAHWFWSAFVSHKSFITRFALLSVLRAVWVNCGDTICARADRFWGTLVVDETFITRFALFSVLSTIWIHCCNTVRTRANRLWDTLFTNESRIAGCTLFPTLTGAVCNGNPIGARTRERRGSALSTSQGAAVTSIGTVC